MPRYRAFRDLDQRLSTTSPRVLSERTPTRVVLSDVLQFAGGTPMTQTATQSAESVDRSDDAAERRLPVLLALGFAVAGGLLTLLAFPNAYVWPMAPIGVAMLGVAVYRQRARVGALLGLAYGLSFFLVLIYWVKVIGYDAWVALSVIEALYIAGMAAVLAVVSKLRLWPLWAACLWVAQEFVRGSFPFGGFSWGRLAFGETSTPFTPLASVGGAPLVTFAVALTGSLLAWAALHVTRRRLWSGVAAAGALALAFCGLLVPAPQASGRTFTVAVVQGNVPRQGLDFLGQREAVLRNHAEATHQLAADVEAGKVPKPDIVVWPENSSDVNPFADAGAKKVIDDAVADIGVPVLVGTLVDTPDGKNLENTGIVWDPKTGPGDRYVKQHLVPFGEYIPFRPVLTKFIGRLSMIPRDFVPGDDARPVQMGGYQVGDVMCFDVAFDDAVRKSMDGASLLTVQTNNATYGGTLQLDQQFSMSRLRAVEHGRPVAIAATSGISAVIRPDGSVQAKSKEFTRAVFVERVPLVTTTTLADRVGPWPERVMIALAVLAFGAAVYRRFRVRGMAAR